MLRIFEVSQPCFVKRKKITTSDLHCQVSADEVRLTRKFRITLNSGGHRPKGLPERVLDSNMDLLFNF